MNLFKNENPSVEHLKTKCGNKKGTKFTLKYKERSNIKSENKKLKIKALFCDICREIHIRRAESENFDDKIKIDSFTFTEIDFQIVFNPNKVE